MGARSFLSRLKDRFGLKNLALSDDPSQASQWSRRIVIFIGERERAVPDRLTLCAQSKGKRIAPLAYQQNEMEKIRRAVEMLCYTKIYGLRRRGWGENSGSSFKPYS